LCLRPLLTPVGGGFLITQKMEETFVDVFSKFGFPTALVIVFILIALIVGRKAWEYLKKHEEANLKLRDQYIEYLQKANGELISVVKENTIAFNSFSIVLEKLEKKINS
jgi:hypothetical protein